MDFAVTETCFISERPKGEHVSASQSADNFFRWLLSTSQSKWECSLVLVKPLTELKTCPLQLTVHAVPLGASKSDRQRVYRNTVALLLFFPW